MQQEDPALDDEELSEVIFISGGVWRKHHTNKWGDDTDQVVVPTA